MKNSTLDWGAGSLGIDLGYAYMIKRIVLKLKGGAGKIRKEQIALSTSMYNREELFKEQEFDMKEAQDGTLTSILREQSYSRYIKIHSHINPLDADGEPIRPAEVFELDTDSVQVYAALSGEKNVFYQYAPDGDRQSRAERTDQIRSDNYAYYPMSDLVRIVGEYAYRYDENGNLIEKGDVYDESGEDVSIEQSGDYTLFDYDLLNRMVSVSKIDADTGALRQVVSYRYNHKNLRIERTDDEGTTRYVFDLAGNIIEEHDAEGLMTRYVFRNNKHLAKITPDGKTYYYGTDNLGSTTVLFDEDGDVVWKGEISAFGDVVLGEWIGEELFAERVRFTGKDYDEVTGLYYFNARWYDPRLGRFTSEDPIRDGMNWHVYVRNNPLRYVDPTGLIYDDDYFKHDSKQKNSDSSGDDSGDDDAPKDRSPSGDSNDNDSNDGDSNTPSKQLEEEETGDSFWDRLRKWWNGGWKKKRMERREFIPEGGTYTPDEIDSLYSLYLINRAITTAKRDGHIDQPSAEDLRNAIGDAKKLILYWSSGGGLDQNLHSKVSTGGTVGGTLAYVSSLFVKKGNIGKNLVSGVEKLYKSSFHGNQYVKITGDTGRLLSALKMLSFVSGGVSIYADIMNPELSTWRKGVQIALNAAAMTPIPQVGGVGTVGSITMAIWGDQIESKINARAAEISRQVNYYMNNPIDFMSEMTGVPPGIYVPKR